MEATGKNIESKLSEKEKEIQLLRQRDSLNTDAIANLSDQLTIVMYDIGIVKKVIYLIPDKLYFLLSL